MASKRDIVDSLALAAGKDSEAVKKRLEDAVGDITVDILSQNKSRFLGLRRSQSITITSGDTEYRLNADFASMIPNAQVVDSDGVFIAEFTIVDELEYVRRQVADRLPKTRYAFIEPKDGGDEGPGLYLILAQDWGETAYLKIYYYRKPTTGDTELITNTAAIKKGVKAELPDLFGREEAIINAGTYERMKSGIKESPATTTTGLKLQPSKRTRKRNLFFWRIGGGR